MTGLPADRRKVTCPVTAQPPSVRCCGRRVCLQQAADRQFSRWPSEPFVTAPVVQRSSSRHPTVIGSGYVLGASGALSLPLSIGAGAVVGLAGMLLSRIPAGALSHTLSRVSRYALTN